LLRVGAGLNGAARGAWIVLLLGAAEVEVGVQS
jgi:hypothetical protein